MGAAAEALQHFPGARLVVRLAENPTVAFGHRVAGQQQPGADSLGHVGRFLMRQPSHKLGRTLPASRAGFGGCRWGTNLEVVARRRKQLPAAR